MGTHISKVKSVDLDVWTVEQMNVGLKLVSTCRVYLTSRHPSRYQSGETNGLTLTGKHI